MIRLLSAALLLASASAFAVEGTLSGTPSWAGPVTVTGDVTIPSGSTLTIQPGAVVTAATTDSQGSGDASKVEIFVQGTLIIAGVNGGGVTLTGAGSGASAWGGIIVKPGGTATISYAAFDKMASGLSAQRGATGITTTLTVSNTTITGSTYGFQNTSVTTGGTVNTTLTNVTVAAATGASVIVGNFSATDSRFSGGASYGFYQEGGVAQLTRVAFVKNAYGMYLYGNSGSTTCDQCTVAYNTNEGITEYSYSGNTHTTTVSSSIISHNGGRAIYRSYSSYGSFGVTSSNVWGNYSSAGTANANNGPTQATNFTLDLTLSSATNRSFNPLYVDAANNNFRLTHRSPSRKSGGGGVDQGAYAYTTDQTVGLQGEFWEDATLSAGPNAVLGDLLVAPGVTLTISPGATLTFDTNDSVGGGALATKGELLVYGTLQAVGVSGSSVTFTGTATGNAAWGGINVRPGGAATVANAALDKMQGGFVAARGATNVTTSLTVSNTDVTNSTVGFTNLNVTSGGTLTTTLTNVTVAAATGAYVEVGNFSATDSRFSGGTSYGFYQEGGTAQLTRVAIVKNAYGMYLYGTSGVTTCDRCTIAYNTNEGITEYSYSGNTHTTTVSSSIISHNGGRGIYRSYSSYGSFGVTSSNVWGNYSSAGTANANNAATQATNFTLDLSLTSATNRSYNPLYVDAANNNFRLTHRSPSRKSGGGGADQGALSYVSDQTAGLQGEFWEDATLAGANAVLGDLLVAPGVTLTISPGAVLTFAATDSVGGAGLAAKGELLVFGTLQAVGVSGSPVTFTGAASGNTAWGGLNVRPGGSATLANAVLDKMQLGVIASRGAAGVTTSLSISNTNITTSTMGVVNESATTGGTLTTSLTGVSISAATGISVVAGTLTGQALVVSGGTSYGLYQEGGTVQLERAAFVNNGYGVYLYGSSGVTSCDRCTVAYNTNEGITEYSYSGNTHTTTLVSSIVTNNGGRGIYRSYSSYGSFGVTYSNIWGNYGSAGTANANNVATNMTNYTTTLASPPATSSPFNISANPLFADPVTFNYSLQSTSPSRSAGASSVDQGAFPYSVGAVASVTVSPATATVNAGGITGFAAQARDAQGNIVNDATFNWTVTPAAGTISGAGVLTASCTPGTYTAAITATSTNGTSATASVVINIGPASQVAITPNNANVKSQGTQQYTATVRDSCNNVISGPTITWSSNATAGTITSTGLFTASCTRNSYTNGITATASSLSGSVNVNVVAGDPFAVGVTPSSVTVPAGTTQQFAASVADGCGNTVSTPVTWSTSATGSSINGTGLFSAGQTNGTFTNGVTATAGTKTGSSTVTVTGGSGTMTVASVVVTPGSASLSPGGQQTFSATAYDSNGQALTGQTITWSAASGGTITSGGVFTAGNTAGNYTNAVTATVQGVSGNANVTINPGAVATVVVSPATVTLAPGGQATFNAVAKDAFNNTVTGTVTWSATAAAGTITQGGVLTATTSPGTYAASVTATVGSVSGTADVTVANGALSQLTVSPPAASVQAGGQVAFTATGRDASSNPVAVTPTWSVVNGGGTISTGGIFSAGTTSGTFANTVKAEAQGLSAFASVTVTPGPVLSVTVSPGTATVQANGSIQFTAEAKDAFSNVVATGFTWTAQSGAGVITQGGFFTAAADPGAFPNSISASASGITGYSSVTVTPSGTGGGTGNTGGGAGTGGGTAVTGGGDGSTGGGTAVTGGGDGSTGGGSAVTGGGSGTTGGGSAVTGGGSASTGGGTGNVNGGTGCGCSSADASLFAMALLVLARIGRRQRKS